MKKQAWETRMDALDARLARIAEIQERTDKRIDSVVKLMRMGAKQLIRMEEAQTRFFEQIARPTNGHPKEKP